MRKSNSKKLSGATSAVLNTLLGEGVVLAVDHVRQVRNSRISAASANSDGNQRHVDSARAFSMCP